MSHVAENICILASKLLFYVFKLEHMWKLGIIKGSFVGVFREGSWYNIGKMKVENGNMRGRRSRGV